MFNSEEYAWSDLEVVMLGKVVTGITGIKYKASQSKERGYAKGNDPHFIIRGAKTYEGEIKLLQSELEALQKGLKAGQSILDIKSFEITVAYAPEGGQITTDILKGVEFLEVEKALNQGDGFMEVTLPIFVGKIEYNV